MRGHVMYVIAMKENEKDGAYAVRDEDNEKVVFCFDEKDDAERYALLLESEGNPTMKVVELDDMVAIAALNETQTKWAIITPEDIVVPPDELTDY